MAKASILISYLLKQSDIRNFCVNHTFGKLAFVRAHLDRAWPLFAFHVTTLQGEMTEDL